MKRYILPRAGLLALAVLFSLCASGSAILVQFTKGKLLDQALAGLNKNTIQLIALLLSFILFEMLCHYTFDRLRGLFFVRGKSCLRKDFFKAQLERNPAEMQEEKQGMILAAYTDQIELAGNSYLFNLPLLFDVILKIILVSTALFWLDVRVAGLTLLLLTTPLFVPKLIEARLQASQVSSTQAFQEHLGKVAEWLNGFELIKNFGAKRPIFNLFIHSNHEVEERDYALRKMGYLSQSLSALLSYLSHFIILAYSAWLVLKGSFTAGSFFIAVGMIDQLSYPIISISRYIQEITAARPVVKEILEEIDLPSEDRSKTGKPQKPYDVHFRHLDFAHANGNEIFNDFNLNVLEGEKCLITGPSGGGKTTLMNLLLGYYPLDQGTLTVGGIPTHEAEDLSRYISIMRQDPILFSDTLRNNLSLYQPVADDVMIRMLEKLNLHDFANTEALNRVLQEGGQDLSGGERKRICLARTLLRASPIIILDEPLANVDPETAYQVANLITSIKGRTLFVISHVYRPSWLDTFDHQVVVGKE